MFSNYPILNNYDDYREINGSANLKHLPHDIIELSFDAITHFALENIKFPDANTGLYVRPFFDKWQTVSSPELGYTYKSRK